MNITLDNIGKRFRYEWIFRGIQYSLEMGNTYAITGPNGSGKSTLLRVLAGQLIPSEGKVRHNLGGKDLDADHIYRHVSYAAPYVELIEEFTLTEMLHFFSKFKPWRNRLRPDDIIGITYLEKSAHKPLKYFSSGMKQRLKIAMAICTDTKLLILDEPNTNLDTAGIAWYRDLLAQHHQGRITLIASNMESDFPNDAIRLHLPDFKPRKQNT